MCANLTGEGENRSAIVMVPAAPGTDALGFGHAAPEDEAVPDHMCIGCECVFETQGGLSKHQNFCPAYAELESESEDEEEEEESEEDDDDEEEEEEEDEDSEQGRGPKRARRTPGVED